MTVGQKLLEYMLEKHGNMKILPNTQRLGKLTFDSNQVKKSKTNPNVLIAKASDGKEYGVVRKSDGSYDFAGSDRNLSLKNRLNIASASPNIADRALGITSTLISEPQRIMTRALTNNRYNTPSEVVANSKLPDGRLKNTLGFAADMIADPTNLVGAGIGAKTLSSLSKVANKIPITQIKSLPKFSMPRSLKGFSVEDLRNLTQQPGITIQQVNKVMDFKNRKVENILANRFRENEQYIEEIRRRNGYSESQNRSNTSSVVSNDIPTVSNWIYSRSGFTREGILNRVDDKTKELIKNLPDEDFRKIVLKPNGEVDFIASDLDVRRNISGIEQMSREDYVKKFNDNLPRLNEIIAKKNTSGVPYTVTGIDESGRINFNSSKGPSYFRTGLVPGKFKGEVQDIADANYYKNLPGLNMGNTMSGVFGDGVARRGTKTYESINDYLKLLDLGRVKPGFNSQTNYSRGAWENFVKSGKAVGYYNNTGTVYGSMKTILPPAAIAAGAAASTMNKKDSNNKFKYGGKLLPSLNKF